MIKSSIAILSTVSNFDFYNKTSQAFPNGVKKYVIDGRNGMHGIHSIYFMMKILKGKDIKWLIMADEDVFFRDTDSLYRIIERMEQDNYIASGVRDGGVINHRVYNPIAINTFFSILNFEEISKIWDKREVKMNQYIEPGEFDTPKNLLFDSDLLSLYEPYYCFYFWLLRKGKKILYLEADNLSDGISNSVKFNGLILLHHTWQARSYGRNKYHTDRINKLLKDSNLIDKKEMLNYILFKDNTFKFKYSLRKFHKKITLKIMSLINKNIE